MPRAGRICNKLGCPEIVFGANYCPTHKLPAWENSTRNKKNPPGWARTRSTILHRANNTCAYCGAYATEVDHVTPVSQGGTHHASNLVAACTNCNKQKNYAERQGKTWTPPNKATE
jgi:5-methylcytosine-specific restriction protein A